MPKITLLSVEPLVTFLVEAIVNGEERVFTRIGETVPYWMESVGNDEQPVLPGLGDQLEDCYQAREVA